MRLPDEARPAAVVFGDDPRSCTASRGRSRGWLRPLAPLFLALGLQGCERGADSGHTANPVAPGRPGTGNPVETVQPRPGSITESPQVGGARGRVPEGITGSGGTTDVPGELQGRSYIPQQPGVGLHGGVGATAPDAAASSPAGTPAPARNAAVPAEGSRGTRQP